MLGSLLNQQGDLWQPLSCLCKEQINSLVLTLMTSLANRRHEAEV